MGITKIGVCGVGVVGGAIKRYYKEKGFDVRGYDRDPDRSDCTFEDLKKCDVVFVSVPTLTNSNGSQALMPFLTVMQNFDAIKFKGIIVHKCTVIPGTTKYFASQYPKLRIVHCPEFLTEANAFNDFKNAIAVMLSGHPGDVAIVSDILEGKIIHTFDDYESTEIAKYVHNCFLATKVSFMNEMFDVCKHFNVEYEPMIKAVSWMGGIGQGHLKVPGPDGLRGWGGMCFVKDTQAFINAMAINNIWLEVLAGAIKTNKKVRGE
jgi:UDPglucose 6-dehydrogenase